MRYLTAKEILVIHARIIDATSGLHGIRDLELLQSIVHKPQTVLAGREMYLGVFTKAAVYLDTIAHHHIFIDGNKRTAIASAIRFLYLSGYVTAVTHKEMVAYILHVVMRKPALGEIAAWLKKHSKKSKK